jgi:hypothetical protein
MVSQRRKLNCILSASNCLLSSIFFFYILLLCSFPKRTQGLDFYKCVDCLKRGERTTLKHGETLVSSGGRFELGFFNARGSTSNKSYVGIWYHEWDQKTFVWVANRDKPVLNGSTGVSFGIAEDGNLKVWDNTTGDVYWNTSVEISSSANRTVKLMDSGNLVLSDDGDDQLATSRWESFQNPTDTFLPGMKMNESLTLTSWAGDVDPGSGGFTFKQYKEESGHYVITKRLGRLDYWRSWMSGKLSSTDELMPYAIAYLLSNFSKSLNQTKYPLPPKSSAQLLLDYNYTRLVMNYNGELQYLKWDADKGNWSMIWREPEDNCSIYNAFGKFGSCNISLSAAVSVSQLKIEPSCTSSRDCKDWPNSTCNRGTDGKKRCLCNGSFQWDGSNSNCTKG